ncbi:methyl-accepting chemotaxis protein [Acidovorax sp.]|uniref:methyl-accepting chemotaxis protein n=1 Tax=Acidovorax sp. TaxID=1872122 RepID=UPI0025BCCE56|nr:methyl-accepting chemotaxis protein [Acidovorax sp.]MBL7090351.1 MCP four helix bundle domain-containing protein [Acidovorax sp.]
MNNLKISTRLSGAFGLLVALLLIMSATAWVQLRELRAGTEQIADNWLPSVQAVNAFDSGAALLRLIVLDHVRATDQNAKARLDKQIEDERTKLADMRKRYEKLISSPQEQKLYDEFAGMWTKYVEVNNRALEMSRNSDNASAADIMTNESGPMFLAMKAQLDKLVKLNAEGSAAAAAASADTYATARNIVLLVSVVALGLAIASAAWLIRSITAPLARAVEAADRVAAGDLSGQIVVQSKDETGLLLAALQRMQQSLVNTVALVRQNAEGVASASSQIASGNNDLSARTEQQASALEETAASMEELGSTVRQNADNARTANQLAVNASAVAVQGGDVVAEVVETMKGINASSNKIADIISVIDGIAFQTNILALNAAVEAARAGEQGRGFAVVASEVRNLAGRSAEAAKEIKSLITASVERVEQGTALVDKAGATMTEVVASIRRVTDIMGEISAASSEQSAGVGQVGEAVTQMDQATQQNAALVEEMAAAASALNAQAGELVNAVAVFKLDANSTSSHSPVRTSAAPARAPIAAPSYKAPARSSLGSSAKGSGSKPASLAAPKTGSAAIAAPKPATPSAAPAKAGGNDDDWESF